MTSFHMISKPSFFHICPVAPIYRIMKSIGWQIIFGFMVIDPPGPSHLTFISEESMTPIIYMQLSVVVDVH